MELHFYGLALLLTTTVFTIALTFNRIARYFQKKKTYLNTWAQKVDSIHLRNLYQLNADVFRSAQPNRAGVHEIKEMGIRTILNLRHLKQDTELAKGTGLKLLHLRINTWTISYQEVIQAVLLLKTAPKPVLVHCLHGSDRTGIVLAVYRIAVDGWSKQEAIQEFCGDPFGYHKNYFPHLLQLLNSLDVEKVQKDLKELEKTINT